MANVVEVGRFCPNADCPKYGQTEDHRLIQFGKSRQGKQRYRCQCCGETFNENYGTLFYRKRTPVKDIMETLALLAEGNRVSSLSRTKGFKEDTIVGWLREAGAQAEAVSARLLEDYAVGASQIDGLWSYVGHKGAKKTARNRDGGDLLAGNAPGDGHASTGGRGSGENGNGGQRASASAGATAGQPGGAATVGQRWVGGYRSSAD
jgi:transposase-like protein